jgi:ubiquinone/menaquinone biosynthesis C-methylase UbiE
MPTVEQNQQAWIAKYDWLKEGEEWSATWGGSEAQWFGAIFPRIHSFVPTNTILEIAPGFGRWTHYLKGYCDRLIVVDLAENCIRACKERFAADSNITYHVNDGKSLAMIPDQSIDVVFSFDSLVHAEADAIQAYLNQLARKLKPNGVGFIHHSNIGRYRKIFSASQTIPGPVRKFLIKRGLLDLPHWRGFTMTARRFEEQCDEAGMQCISQELVNWGTKRLIDCFSLFTPKMSTWARPNEIVENRSFMREADSIRRISGLYATEHLRREHAAKF